MVSGVPCLGPENQNVGSLSLYGFGAAEYVCVYINR